MAFHRFPLWAEQGPGARLAGAAFCIFTATPGGRNCHPFPTSQRASEESEGQSHYSRSKSWGVEESPSALVVLAPVSGFFVDSGLKTVPGDGVHAGLCLAHD